MTAHLTLDDLKRIMREVAGADETVDFDADILDTTFLDLGYDSLALLETGSRIERDYAVALDDETVTGADTPRALLGAVNSQLPVA
ncbi:acyl carrier protein [Paractinoplanes rishiriensis]|uniref:Actinorhodin polyketide synthase acyl carrier protein n=1 Tax=Paractinoplanes rishiriensis TaxID=1050105 RepID=A0A919JQD3_9ACTN|nr:acyl carrier protein [Actinoplanes rishiriensis]GIE92970.1 actinorhodin polyketide synthase acyl carrier protein [Actinoplanes rishiriensis]